MTASGLTPTLLQLFSEGDLDGEVGGLCDLCFAHARTGFVGAKFVDQRPVRVLGQLAIGAQDARGERGIDIKQSTAHLPRLRTHAGTDERQLRHRWGCAAGEDLSAIGEGLKLFLRIGNAAGHEGGSIVQVRAALTEGVAKVEQRDVAMSGQVFGQLAGGRDERFLRACRDRQDSQWELLGCLRCTGADGGRRLREDDVGVGATETERVDACDASIAVGKGATGSRNLDAEVRQRNLLAGVLEVQIRGDVPVFEDQRCFDEPGDPRPGLEVADVRFDRSDQQWIRCRAFGGERIGESPDLDWVADRCSGAVRLHIPDVIGVDAGSSQCCRYRRFLCFGARYGDAVGMAVL